MYSVLEDINGPQYYDFKKGDTSGYQDDFFDNKVETPTLLSRTPRLRFRTSERENVEFEPKSLKVKSVFVFTADPKNCAIPKNRPAKITRFKPVVKPEVTKQPLRTTRAQKNEEVRRKAQNGVSFKRVIPLSSIRPTKKPNYTTQPTSPQCLKRNNNKVPKVIKSSEDLELERIAYLQMQTRNHLKANRKVFKKTTKNVLGTEQNLKGSKNVISEKAGRSEKRKGLGSVSDFKSFSAVKNCTSTPFEASRKPEHLNIAVPGPSSQPQFVPEDVVGSSNENLKAPSRSRIVNKKRNQKR